MTSNGLLELIEPFYEEIDQFWPIQTGQFCHVVTPYLKKVPQILEIIDFKISGNFEARKRNVRCEDFLPKSFPEPLKHFKFTFTERPLFVKAKKRPVITINPTHMGHELLDPIINKPRQHFIWKVKLGIPVYSLETEERRYSGIPQEVGVIANYLQLPQFFYCPPPDFVTRHSISGIARIDRMFLFYPQEPAVKPTKLRLTQEACNILLCMIEEWIGIGCEGKVREDFKALKKVLHDEFEDKVKDKISLKNKK